MSNTFLYYDYLPDLCDYVIDYPDSYYLDQGLKPKHRNIKWSPNDIIDGSVIFVKNLLIEQFFKTIYPKINNRFYLISGRAGFDINIQYKQFLNENKIIKWIGTNIMWTHEKIFKVPIGFEENERCIDGPASNNGQHEGGDQNTLLNAYTTRSNFADKKNKLALTYCGETHPIRKNINNILSQKDFVEILPKLKFKEYMKTINEYKFVLCPRGTGEDTHRFWETLLTNSIPIIKKSELNDFQLKFPCIIVNEFSDINIELLNNFELDEDKLKNVDKYLLLKNITKIIKEEINR